MFPLNKGLSELYLYKHKSNLYNTNMKVCSGEAADVCAILGTCTFRHMGLGMCAQHLPGALALEGELLWGVFILLSFVILLNETFLPIKSFFLPSPFPGLS